MTLHEEFNQSRLSRFINSVAGRAFRLTAGATFLIAGYFFRAHLLGVLSMLWSILPLTAGGFDLCYISAVLGGPLSGKASRAKYGRDRAPRSARV